MTLSAEDQSQVDRLLADMREQRRLRKMANVRSYPPHRRHGTPMKMRNRFAMARWVVKHKPEMMKELGFTEQLRLGNLSRPQVYGFHPTKSTNRKK